MSAMFLHWHLLQLQNLLLPLTFIYNLFIPSNGLAGGETRELARKTPCQELCGVLHARKFFFTSSRYWLRHMCDVLPVLHLLHHHPVLDVFLLV